MKFIESQWTPSAKQRRTPSRSVLDVSGFAGIMLALLFLMMFGLFYPAHPVQAPVDMSVTQNSTLQPAALREDALEVAITRDGTVYFRNHRGSASDLPDLLRQAVRDGAEKTVYVKADARAKYGDVKAVLDEIRQSGLQNITFLTEHPPAASTP
jgi:biopolymer transport protein ExbD